MVRGRSVQAVEPADEEDTGRVNPAVQGVQALTRGLALLDIVADSKRPLRFSEIADAAGLAKGTVHRMLAALVEARFLQLDSRTQTYRLGVRLFEMAHRVWNEFDLRGAAEPELERLRDVTGEAVRLAVLQGAEILYIDQREAMQAIRLANGVGGRAAAYATSAGKAILAHLDPAMRHRLLSTLELKRFTPNTITDAARVGTRARSHRRARLCHLRGGTDARLALGRGRDPRSSIQAARRDLRAGAVASVSTSTSCMRWGAR